MPLAWSLFLSLETVEFQIQSLGAELQGTKH